MIKLTFPKNFIWGTSTSAYQIEGAHTQDGKGPSIWDSFSHRKGKVRNNDTGDTACDHYNRFEEDFGLLKQLGYPSYRFSISWPRIFPEGKGKLNEKGLDFYDRLTDSLLEKKITPFATLYHWDLPDMLEDTGGWFNRDTAFHFADYSEVVVKRLGDRIKNWITINEPWIVMVTGYVLGVLAPGFIKPFKSLKVAHNLLLAHGLSLGKIKSLDSKFVVGITNAHSPVHSNKPGNPETKAKTRADALLNKLWLDPIYKGTYPEEIAKLIESQNKEIPLSDDLKIISGKTDFLGINHYSRTIVRYAPIPIYSFMPVKPSYPGARFTSMGWEVYPEGFHELLTRIKRDYNNPPIYITENGISLDESPEEDGKIYDTERIDYIKEYLSQVHRAIQDGCDIRGYYVWSFLDNLEWAEGFSKTFGLIHIDRKNNLKRTPKQSAEWYGEVCKNNGFEY